MLFSSAGRKSTCRGRNERYCSSPVPAFTIPTILPRMGSEKNKMRNTHRRVFESRKRKYRKKKVSQVRMGEQHVNCPEVSEREKYGEGTVKVEGSRIINIHKLSEYLNELTVHAAKCDGAFTLDGETRDGLASILPGRCSVCRYAIQLETSPKVKGPKQYRRWECNLAAVWGLMVTGGGHSHLEEILSILGVPVMSKKKAS